MVRNTLIFYGLCGAISFAHVASARGVRLQGHAADADTGQPLALATVQVVGTFTGTIANSAATRGINFELPVTPHRLPEMIVRPDEARRIMAEVIWQREGGYREVVVSQRRTENLDDLDLDFGTMSAVDEFIDLYDDNIVFMENELMGPTHPDALDVYDFDLIGRRLVDDRVVFDIGVRPKHKPDAAFVGRVSVVDGDFALIEADLSPSRSILEAALPIPLFEEFSWGFGQQWREYDGVWLPVDYRFEGIIRIGTFGLHFPEIGVRGVTRMSKYEVNVDLPDSLFLEEETVRVDSALVRADTAFTRGATGVPLTAAEAAASRTPRAGRRGLVRQGPARYDNVHLELEETDP